MSIAAALNYRSWERDDQGEGGSPTAPMVCKRWAEGINLGPNSVLAFNHLFLIVRLGFVRILLNIVKKCF